MANKKCPHGREKWTCKECKGGGICPCGKVRYYCRACKGGGFCEHGRHKRGCHICVGTYICEHDRRRDYCKECKGLPAAVKQLYWAAKRRSREECVPFNITKEHILELIGNGTCPIFGVCYNLTSRKSVDNSMTLDKLNPKLGYVIGNCAIISRLANNIKSSATSVEVYKVANWMALHGV